MDYQRACGVTGRGMPLRIHGNQSWQMGRQPGERPEARMPEHKMPENDCCEHLAIVTSPVQCWQNLYAPCEGLSAGTLFKDLHLPLVGCPGSTYGYRRMGGLQ